MEISNTEKIILINLLKIEIEKLCKKKNYRGLNKNEKIEYKVFCDLYKRLEKIND